MQYTIDNERGILFRIEDDEADRVARIVEQRRLVAVEPVTPEIPLVEAVAACQRISAEQHAALDDCECSRIGVKKCGMCE